MTNIPVAGSCHTGDESRRRWYAGYGQRTTSGSKESIGSAHSGGKEGDQFPILLDLDAAQLGAMLRESVAEVCRAVKAEELLDEPGDRLVRVPAQLFDERGLGHQEKQHVGDRLRGGVCSGE